MQFKFLSIFSDASDTELRDSLTDFVNAYGDWIEKKRRDYDAGDYSELAGEELDKCEIDKERMLTNIDQLLSGEKNEDNIHTFRLMNAAMFMQLYHSVKIKNGYIYEIINNDSVRSFSSDYYENISDCLFVENSSASWRPFQLAFILLNLDGIFQRSDDPEWEFRNELVDLVWFPTGGGKTEAYFGIIAVTIINRRMKHGNEGGGTAVIMRYTLRLLTLQQFQRATVLIMAVELLRRWGDYNLGDEPIYIGMWVGSGSLPNTLVDLEEEYDKIKSQQYNGKSKIRSKIPFEVCPWCGYELNPIIFEKINDRKQIFYYNRILLGCSRTGYKC